MITTMAPERVRITARVSANMQNTLETAAAISGATLNQFMVRSALREAEHIIEQERIIRLSSQDAERFFQAIENPTPPNAKLEAALKRHEDARLDDRGTTFSWEPRPKQL